MEDLWNLQQVGTGTGKKYQECLAAELWMRLGEWTWRGEENDEGP